MSAILKAIQTHGQEWAFETHLDLGNIGEHQVEVFYRHYYENPSNDPYQPPEPEYCEITSVIWEGKDVFSLLSEDIKEDLSFKALEAWGR